MSTLLSLLFSKVGLYAVAAIALVAAGCWLHWRWERGAEPKQLTQVLAVSGAENGATLTIKTGFRGRSAQPVFLAGIAAPGLNDPLGPQSRDNLAALAGETIRLVAPKEPLGYRGTLVGQVFGDTGADLAVAQLTAGLAKCESQATKQQIAAQKAAQAAQRGLWETSGGSHWWHFSVAAAEFPEAIPLEPERQNMPDLFSLLEIILGAMIALLVLYLAWTYVGAPLLSKWSAAAAVTTAVDISAQLAAYPELTLIRYMPSVEANPQAVAACELLLTTMMTWPKSASTSAAAAPAKTS